MLGSKMGGHIDGHREHKAMPESGTHVNSNKLNPKFSKSAMPAKARQNNEDTMPPADKLHDSMLNGNLNVQG